MVFFQVLKFWLEKKELNKKEKKKGKMKLKSDV